ncbi:uncharacterized protein PHACADRAFT_201631 [Phanerochaete carnosa HHB-10118-sp]|nr:uncharacterized protein PHACADRAFT_201631 [Phanerochaete carnosa HHB-10118-sp]EKM49375.1 hypothetical protein PHACADRAFT_201631 [Phanerochaete carnosa HHB-10118-sp]
MDHVGFLQEGAPENHLTVVTRLIQLSYDERQCTYFFPQAFSQPLVPNVQSVNSAYKGWNISINHLPLPCKWPMYAFYVFSTLSERI